MRPQHSRRACCDQAVLTFAEHLGIEDLKLSETARRLSCLLFPLTRLSHNDFYYQPARGLHKGAMQEDEVFLCHVHRLQRLGSGDVGSTVEASVARRLLGTEEGTVVFDFVRNACYSEVVLKDGILERESLDRFNADEHWLGSLVLVVTLDAGLCVDLCSLLPQGHVLCDARLLARVSFTAVSLAESSTEPRTEPWTADTPGVSKARMLGCPGVK